MDLSGKKNICIIRLSSLGDILLTTPLIRSIKNKYPGIQIDFILKEQYKELLQFNPYLSKILEYKIQPPYKKELLKRLRKSRYDLVIDLQNNFRSAQIRRAIKAKSVRFKKRTIDKFLLVKFKINHMKDSPQIPVRYAHVLKKFQLDNEGLDFFLPHSVKSQLGDFDRYVGFTPGSKHFTKMWLKDYYAELGNLLMKYGYLIVLFGGKSDLQICYELSIKIPGSINLCNDNKIFETAIDMKKCRAIVSNDSGLMHLACSLHLNVLAFFGSTVKEFGFTPYGCSSQIMENEGLYCRPCSHIGRETCPQEHFRCMLELKPQSAFEKLNSFLKVQ